MSKEAAEGMPLLPSSQGTARPSYKLSNIRIEEDREYWEDDFDEDEVLFSENKRRGTSLILNDAVILILEYLQYFGLVASLALRWPWPADWLTFCRYELLVNLDVWEFVKLGNNKTYKNVQGYYSLSSGISFSYWHVCVAWAAVAFLIFGSYAICYVILNHKKHPFMLVHVANLRRVYVIVIQLVALPIGVAAFKTYHWTDTYKVDVDNALVAYEGLHWAYIGSAALLAIALYILFPAWLIVKTKVELLSKSSDQHEGYLQLKETEYVQGLDVIYIVSQFHIFSSFKRSGAHYRAASLILKLVVLIAYAALFPFLFEQSLVLTIIFLLILVSFIILRPFRVSAFNSMLCVNYLCLMANTLIGTMQNSFDAYSIRSPWLTPTYLIYTLLMVNGFWLLCAIVFVIYLVCYHFGRMCKEPLWPTMTSRGLDKLSPDTRRYMRAILRARHLLEKCLSMPAIFAPAHELSRQIQIINAYCREAEYLNDPIHGTLWDLLDELIEAHGQIAPKSLFAESIKSSIRQTASELMKVMPMFVRRLAQREYDFILMNPVKRRMLLKMYCLGAFLNGRAEKLAKHKLINPNLTKIWREGGRKHEADDGYYEEMYPEPLQGPNHRSASVTLTLGIDSDEEKQDDEYLGQLDQWATEHPTSRSGSRDAGHLNMAFDPDGISGIFGDDNDSVDLSELMEGVPSLPGSRASSAASRPGSAHPTTRFEQPHAAASRPGSAASQKSRPGSAASQKSRPGSVASQKSQPESAASLKSRPESAAPAKPQQLSNDERPDTAGMTGNIPESADQNTDHPQVTEL